MSANNPGGSKNYPVDKPDQQDEPSSPGNVNLNVELVGNAPPNLSPEHDSGHSSNPPSLEAVHGGSSSGGSRPQSRVDSAASGTALDPEALNMDYLSVHDDVPPSPEDCTGGASSSQPVEDVAGTSARSTKPKTSGSPRDCAVSRQSHRTTIFCPKCDKELGTTPGLVVSYKVPYCLSCRSPERERSDRPSSLTFDYAGRNFTGWRGVSSQDQEMQEVESDLPINLDEDMVYERSRTGAGASGSSSLTLRPSSLILSPSGDTEECARSDESPAVVLCGPESGARSRPRVGDSFAGKSSDIPWQSQLPDLVPMDAQRPAGSQLDEDASDLRNREILSPSQRRLSTGSNVSGGSAANLSFDTSLNASGSGLGVIGATPDRSSQRSPAEILGNLGPPATLSPNSDASGDGLRSPRRTYASSRTSPYNVQKGKAHGKSKDT